jgi:hypothetical protein
MTWIKEYEAQPLDTTTIKKEVNATANLITCMLQMVITLF